MNQLRARAAKQMAADAPALQPAHEAGNRLAAADAYLPLRALAAYAGLSVRTLRSYLAHASTPLPHYRIGGKLLVRRSEYDIWVSQFRARVAPVVDDIVDDVLRSLR